MKLIDAVKLVQSRCLLHLAENLDPLRKLHCLYPQPLCVTCHYGIQRGNTLDADLQRNGKMQCITRSQTVSWFPDQLGCFLESLPIHGGQAQARLAKCLEITPGSLCIPGGKHTRAFLDG